MVAPAEKDQVRELRLATADPVDEVVTVAPRSLAFATRPLAVAVANLESAPQRARDDSFRSAHVDNGGILVEEYARDAAVAGHSLHRGRRDWKRELHLRRGSSAHPLECLDRRGDLDLGGLAARGQVDECVGKALLARPVVVLTGRLGERLERRAH